MFSLTIKDIKPFSTCKKGPEILKWFESRFDDEQELPLLLVLDTFGETHAVFCLRAVKGGPEFALQYAIKCVENIKENFEIEYPGNTLLAECIETASNMKGNSAKEAGHNLEQFCRLKSKGTNATKAGFAASKLSYAAYTISQPHASVDFSLGAIEDSRDAAQNPCKEDEWQTKLFRKMLLEHGECKPKDTNQEN